MYTIERSLNLIAYVLAFSDQAIYFIVPVTSTTLARCL